jgi:hypothetical protein
MTARRLLDGSAHERAAALAELAACDDPERSALDALDECLCDASKLVQRRAAESFAALVRRGLVGEERLRAKVSSGERRARWGAVYALSLIDRLTIDTLPILLEVMGSDDGDLRWAAADLAKRLAAVDRDVVATALTDAARVGGAARKMALYCLRDLAVAAATDVAVDALDDPAIETRLAALAFLAAVHADAAVAAQRIAALVADADPRMQRAAAGTLGGLGIGDASVADALRRARSSSDPSLSRAALRSLRQLGIEPE